MLDSFCEAVGKGPLVLRLGVNVFVSISTSKPYSELDCEEDKHYVGLLDKQ